MRAKCLNDIVTFKAGVIYNYDISIQTDKDRIGIDYWLEYSGSSTGLSEKTFNEFFIDISNNRENKLNKLGL